jgi:hypothetical protein
MTDGSHYLSENSAALRGERSLQRNTPFLDESLVRWAPALCRQDTMKLLTDLAKLRVEFLRVLAERGRRADLDHLTASGVRRAVVQVAPLTGRKVKAAGSIDEYPV